MKRIYVITVLLMVIKLSYAQKILHSDDSLKAKLTFIYVLEFKDRQSIITQNAYIAPSQRDTTYLLRNCQSDVLSPMLKTDGIVIIKVKQSIRQMTLSDVFDLYNV